MEFNNAANPKKSSSRFMYNNSNPHDAEPTVIYDVENDRVTGVNNKPYLVGLSNCKNTPIKSETGLSMFHSEAVEIDGTTHYYFTK